MEYKSKLIDLICGKVDNTGKYISDGQVDTYIKKVMREEYDVENGDPPAGMTSGTYRFGGLQQLDPRYSSTSANDKTTHLVANGSASINNNPLYPPNMIDRLNTPFDHIDRILLQDFAGKNAMDIDGENYFKGLFTFSPNSSGGVSGFTMNRQGTAADYTAVNSKFKCEANTGNGGFFIDSFTYTPFVDYSVSSSKIGIYSDQFLNDYNSGRYEEGYSGEGKKVQADVHRHTLSSNLYELRNLDNDLYNAKVEFREAIESQDEKVYIYTFCEHLATLFAKLSNIRMCHEIYGFKHPHTEWEGMLALDIWYQMLYREIDRAYPFDEKCFDMNPMSRLEVHEDASGEYVEYGHDIHGNTQKLRRGDALSNGLEWIPDDTVGPESEVKFVFIWNQSLWEKCRDVASGIRNTRRECVTPRGVLKKISEIVNRGVPRGDVTFCSEGEFMWFYQKGKVYSDSSKSTFSKYANLHLGRAYELMTPREYCELMNVVKESGGDYVKPAFDKSENESQDAGDAMLNAGCDALEDAFSVMKDKHVFNIFNSSTNAVELFDPGNAQHYSQAQCAIVIERVFSELYKYLQFKSTTGEQFQRHINIDSGYKYLATDTIRNSENPDSKVYYSEDDGIPYMRYLGKLAEYSNGNVDIGLGQQEKDMLTYFQKLLVQSPYAWLKDKWDLCPLCRDQEMHQLQAPEESRGMKMSARDGEYDQYQEVTRKVVVDLNLSSIMSLDAVPGVDGFERIEKSGKLSQMTRTLTNVQRYQVEIDLSSVSSALNRKPKFTNSDTTITYNLLGFSDSAYSRIIKYSADRVLRDSDFPSNDSTLTLYAVWDRQVIVKFYPGALETTGSMPNQVIQADRNVTLSVCGFTPADKWKRKKVEYLNNKKWESVSSDSDEVYVYEFSGWEYVSPENQNTVEIPPDGKLNINYDYLSIRTTFPIITLTAKWKTKYNVLNFHVDGDVYCKALVSTDDRRVPYVQTPVPTDPDTQFVEWDIVPGSSLSGFDNQAFPIICGTGEQGELIGFDSESQIVCLDFGSIEYALSVNALLHNKALSQYTITFRFIDADGRVKPVVESVGEGRVVPSFHIHQKIDLENGNTLVFRYWKLVSGKVSPAMTVVQNAVFAAVYDEISNTEYEPDAVPPGVSDLDDVSGRETPTDVGECPLLSSNAELSPDGRRYCKWLGAGPKSQDFYDQSSSDIQCPYLKLIKLGSGDCPGTENRTGIEKYDTFNRFTLLEIDDISNLIKALIKVNFDIAHREYFLKVDIPEQSDWWYGYEDEDKWISFEPTVEWKFSNFHAANQVENDKLLCTVSESPSDMWITPVNRELLTDAKGESAKSIHYNDFWYYYDYSSTLSDVVEAGSAVSLYPMEEVQDQQSYYAIKPLHVYENTSIQSPVDVNGFVRHRLNAINRSTKQIKTYTSIVKKYRPVIMPNVRDIFNDCANNYTKYQADVNNDYGIFGWCTIPSKTMVNMEYNEESIIVPSSYDHHNRIGSNNFLQMDSELETVYKLWSGDKANGTEIDNEKDSWYYLYAQRDWTYFLKPFFNIRRNSELYSYMLDTYPESSRPSSSDHINGIVFERQVENRNVDKDFGDIARTCQFLARYHHNEKNLRILADSYTKLVSYQKLKELTSGESGAFNSVYGSAYSSLPTDFRFPFQDWIDDYDKTGSYIDSDKYTYNLGQSHAIDDFDEDSVWFYITMTEPVENLEQVLEVEDIMPFVFWWENRGSDNNGPTAYCYGKQSNAKLNYERGGWCYSSAQGRCVERISASAEGTTRTPELDTEHSWHAVQRTIGTDFSKKEYGGTILTSDNSGNVYKGAFDPNCNCTDEKWKIHHSTNAFGAVQIEDPTADRYYLGEEAHGDGNFNGASSPEGFNNGVLDSISGRPMTWNLWNVVRHYVYIKYFKGQNRQLGDNQSAWKELETRTKKYVKSIYRTFQERKYNPEDETKRLAFGDDLGGGMSTNIGQNCTINWTNSFVEISSILEPNARDHQASFVLFTGNVPELTSAQKSVRAANIGLQYPGAGLSPEQCQELAVNQYRYDYMLASHDNFRITTTDDIDCGNETDGMRPRREGAGGTYVDMNGETGVRIYQGFKYSDMPVSYLLGDNAIYSQRLQDVEIGFTSPLDLDVEYPEAEYHLGDSTRKWVKRIMGAVMNRQIVPVYTSMENMTVDVHDLTVEDMKSITFQVVPQFYWKYEWSFNEFMVHRVGELDSPSDDIVMYDMLGNVWEWVRDDWSDRIKEQMNGSVNPITGTQSEGVSSDKKVIKGGAFDQFCRSTIAPSREGLERNKCQSKFGTQANVGFRPAMTFIDDKYHGTGGDGTGFRPGTDPVDLFFLFDASASQDNEIVNMVEKAEEIVKIYSPKITEDTPSEDQLKICKVGSALFLGPKIRLMCSKLYRPNNLDEDSAKVNGENKDGYTAHHLLKRPRPGRDKTTLVFSANSDALQKKWKKRKKTMYEWAGKQEQKDNGWFSTDENEFDFPEGETEWFFSKFNECKAKYLSEDGAYPSQRGISQVDPVDENYGESGKEFESQMMFSSRDAQGGGATGSGGASYDQAVDPYSIWTTVKDHLYVHHGVSAWKDGDGKLHMEQDNLLKEQCEMNPEDDKECHLFTYDPRPEAAEYFENPFMQSKRGVLMNWFNGSEPVCNVLANLLDTGFFHDFPYTPAIGYMFRSPEVPKIVFVFTNEFDNAVNRTHTNNGENIMVIPGVMNNNEVKFYPTHGVYENFAELGGDKLTLGVWYNERTSAYNTPTPRMGCVVPPDPYCLQQLNPYWKNWGSEVPRAGIANVVQYLSDIFATEDTAASSALEDLVNNLCSAVDQLPQPKNTFVSVWPMYRLNQSEKDAERRGTVVQVARQESTPISGITSIKPSFDMLHTLDGGFPTSTGGWTWKDMRNILTDYQVDCLLANKYFPGIVYKGGKIKIGTDEKPYDVKKDENGSPNLGVPDYIEENPNQGFYVGAGEIPTTPDELLNRYGRVPDPAESRTLGFYQLKNAVRKLSSPITVFLFTTDANAPAMLDEDQEIWFLENDHEFLREIWDEYAFTDSDNHKLKWCHVAGLNAAYLASNAFYPYDNSNNTKWADPKDFEKDAETVRTIFGFHNPYKNINIVWGIRNQGLEINFEDEATSNANSWVYIVGAPLNSKKSGYQTAKGLLDNVIKKIKVFDLENSEDPENPVEKLVKTYADFHNAAERWKFKGDEVKQVWKLEDWKNNKNNCRMCLTEANADLHVVKFKRWDFKGGLSSNENPMNYTEIEDVKPMLIDKLVSGESIRKDEEVFNTFSYGDWRNSYAFSKWEVVDDVTTIKFADYEDENGKTRPGGILKIISWTTIKRDPVDTHDNPAECVWKYNLEPNLTTVNMEQQDEYQYNTHATNNHSDNRYFQNGFDSGFFSKINNCVITRSSMTWDDIMDTFLKKSTETDYEYPKYPRQWKRRLRRWVDKYGKYSQNNTWLDWKTLYDISKSPGKNDLRDNWNENPTLNDTGAQLYRNIKTAMPHLLAHRFQKEVFANLRNSTGNLVTDYSASGNPVKFVAVPAYNYDKLTEIFDGVRANLGDIGSSEEAAFQYTHCVIDLNPDSSDGGLASGQFPMKFMQGVVVDSSDEYKTTKIVLQRIERISGNSHDTFSMGSHLGDYDKVTDPNKIQYSGDDVDMEQSRDDSAEVTLGNGGSYQKRHPELGVDDPHPDDDLYNVPADEDKPEGKRKYRKNRHFFMDPFELTIAQWCYVHGWNTTSSARTNLGDKLREIETSYWEYLRVWEKDEWTNLMTHGITRTGATIASPSVFSGKTQEECIQWLVDNGKYDPLDDTRPYYYATYNDVRGTGKVYNVPTRPDSIPAANWKWSAYVIDSAKGDEFQLNGYTESKFNADGSLKTGQVLSFMDILNSNVVYQTRKREYTVDPNGGEIFDAASMEGQNDAEKSETGWRAGKFAGLNFDLPTEAQWEYCCRAGCTAPVPPDSFLGTNFEEKEPALDLIAWYRYKVIGSRPEPERFCTWRISKMLFGMARDREQINNVYETTPD